MHPSGVLFKPDDDSAGLPTLAADTALHLKTRRTAPLFAADPTHPANATAATSAPADKTIRILLRYMIPLFIHDTGLPYVADQHPRHGSWSFVMFVAD